MILIANRQLTGSYGTVTAGQQINVSDEDARVLLASGVATLPVSTGYETKVIVAAPVAARPFRHGDHADAEQPGAVLAPGAGSVPSTDVPAPGTPDRPRRRGRPPKHRS